MSEKKKREGTGPSQRDGQRDETDSLTIHSIPQDGEKIKRVCENLLDYAKACRYALSCGEGYASLPMREEDAADFEWAAEVLETLGSALLNAQAEKSQKPPKPPKSKRGEPVGEFRIYADETGCALLSEALGAFEEMRNRKKKPLTEYARHRAIAKLQSLSSDPQMQAEIVLQSVDRCWDGFFALKEDGRQNVSVQSANSSFDTDEFFRVSLQRSLAKYEQ